MGKILNFLKSKWLIIAVLVLAFGIGAFTFHGCDSDHKGMVLVNNHWIPVASHYKETFSKPHVFTTSTSEQDTKPIYQRDERKGSIQGPEAGGTDVKLNLLTAPVVDLDKMTSENGTFKGTAKYVAQPTVFLVITGIICIIGGLAIWKYLKQKVLGIGCMIIGGGLILLAVVPALAWAIVLPVVVIGSGFLGYWIYTHYIHVTAATQVISNGETLKDLIGSDSTIGAIIGNTSTLLAEKETQVKARLLELFNIAQSNQTPATKAIVNKVQS